ncbi:MAG: c-type cytochrome biogenesis protein CcmI [Yoonia sp.]|nr:c-type cytochrome biogenesis protein CcmI [Yoonia sp.]
MIFLWGSLLVALVVASFVIPIVRRSTGLVSHSDSAQAMLRDQLVEIDRDMARGLISSQDGRAAAVEIKRRIIAVDSNHKSIPSAIVTGGWAVVLAGILVPISAIALYISIGSPATPSVKFSERKQERADITQRNDLTQRLRTQLEADENGGPTEGWLLLADAFMRMGQYTDAADAYSRVLERDDATASEFTRFAEALILRDNGQVTPLAERALDRSLLLSPDNPAGIYYKSFALEQAGQVDAAYALLVARLDTSSGPNPWMESFVAQANFYGAKLGKPPVSLSDYAPALRGPTQEDIAGAAELSTEDRNAFIASMVAQLAARLEQEPDDLDGWLQLARAYVVLGDDAGAAAAYQQAAPLVVDLPDGDPRRDLVQQNLAAGQ